MVRFKYIFLVIYMFFCESSLADQCPAAEIVKERKISQRYEWTVDERKTLEDVLAVEKLYSVRIKNKGDFVACYYASEKGLLRLDAKPIKPGCLIKESSGRWEFIDGFETVCKENDLAFCQFDVICNE